MVTDSEASVLTGLLDANKLLQRFPSWTRNTGDPLEDLDTLFTVNQSFRAQER